jgi:hypothetical protein
MATSDTQKVIGYFDGDFDHLFTPPEEGGDRWNYVLEISDQGDGVYDTIAEIAQTARSVIEDAYPGIPGFADIGVNPDDVNWTEVGQWLLDSFKEADGDDF